MTGSHGGVSKPVKSIRAKRILRVVLAVTMIAVGLQHFSHPEPFESIVPNYLPAHHALVLISGFFEIAGGAGLLLPPVQRLAALGLIALYIAVFPANINMAFHAARFSNIAPLFLWLRLPLQLVLIAWAAWLAQRDEYGKAPG